MIFLIFFSVFLFVTRLLNTRLIYEILKIKIYVFLISCSEESDTMWVDSLALSESERLVNRLRNANPERFRTMVKMHLSFYLELPGTGLDELINDYSSGASDIKSKGIFSSFGKNKKNKGKNSICFWGFFLTVRKYTEHLSKFCVPTIIRDW